MMTIEIPKLNFSKWYNWNLRDHCPLYEYPGIYIIAITKKNLKDQKAHLKDADYIGQTVGQKGLGRRWYQFNQSIYGKKGHSGGNAVFNEFGIPYNKWYKKWNLFVAAMGFTEVNPSRYNLENNLLIFGQIAYLEYYAFSKYFKIHGRLPKFNKQHQPNKYDLG